MPHTITIHEIIDIARHHGMNGAKVQADGTAVLLDATGQPIECDVIRDLGDGAFSLADTRAALGY